MASEPIASPGSCTALSHRVPLFRLKSSDSVKSVGAPRHSLASGFVQFTLLTIM